MAQTYPRVFVDLNEETKTTFGGIIYAQKECAPTRFHFNLNHSKNQGKHEFVADVNWRLQWKEFTFSTRRVQDLTGGVMKSHDGIIGYAKGNTLASLWLGFGSPCAFAFKINAWGLGLHQKINERSCGFAHFQKHATANDTDGYQIGLKYRHNKNITAKLATKNLKTFSLFTNVATCKNLAASLSLEKDTANDDFKYGVKLNFSA